MKDGTRMEFDAAYLRGSLLIVIEDKNQVHSDQFERGDTGAPTRRFGQYDRYLQKLRRKVAALLANRYGRNYNLPDQVTSVLSVILSVDVEYIAEQRSDLFLTRDIPVICTFQELIDYLSRTTNEDIAKSPWLLTT